MRARSRSRGIPFSGPMMLALRAGLKTVTRRIVQPQPLRGHYLTPMWGTSPPPNPREFGTKGLWRECGPDYPDGEEDDRRCPYGFAGDRLYARELLRRYDSGAWYYAADGAPLEPGEGDLWRPEFEAWAGRKQSHCPSIHCPRWASRELMDVVDVRPELLRDITEEDVGREGFEVPRCPRCGYSLADCRLHLDHDRCGLPAPPSAIPGFFAGWDQLNAARGFGAARNPWVWRIEFARRGPLTAEELAEEWKAA